MELGFPRVKEVWEQGREVGKHGEDAELSQWGAGWHPNPPVPIALSKPTLGFTLLSMELGF